jgi:hypothetical protein
MSALSSLPAPDAPRDADAAQQRTDVRSNMFVVAVLYADGGSVPVRIRNMSRNGALIEGAVIPPEASDVRLSRGSLSARGRIAWRREDRAGLQLEDGIDPANWLPNGTKPSGQQRVDEIVQACRIPTSRLHGNGDAAAPDKAEAIRELLDLKDALSQVAGELANDPGIAAGFPTALQTIDVAAQRLEKLAAFLAEGS